MGDFLRWLFINPTTMEGMCVLKTSTTLCQRYKQSMLGGFSRTWINQACRGVPGHVWGGGVHWPGVAFHYTCHVSNMQHHFMPCFLLSATESHLTSARTFVTQCVSRQRSALHAARASQAFVLQMTTLKTAKKNSEGCSLSAALSGPCRPTQDRAGLSWRCRS